MSDDALYKTALNKSMTLCSRRELCPADIRARLDSWGLPARESEKIISELIKENFINELRFAEAFARDKFKYNKWGKIKINAHLKAKHIQTDIIKSALDSLDNEAYLKLARDLIHNHRKSVRAKSAYDMKARLLRYGLSKGFENSVLYDILNDPED
jgi:regulatory protein